MVTFSRTPYVEAVARAKRQSALIDRLMITFVAVILLVITVTIILLMK